MTKMEIEIMEGIANLNEINRAYFLAILRSLDFAQEHGEKTDVDSALHNESVRQNETT